MNLTKTTAIIIIASMVTACSVLKKNKKSESGAGKYTDAQKSAMGVFAPGSQELAAMQKLQDDVSMETLVEGYKLYTGVCTECHNPKSIYGIPQGEWKGIISDMAPRAKITDDQKRAIFLYVMAMKSTQPK